MPSVTAPQPNRRRGIGWALVSAIGAAIMVIPWKLANEVGEPANTVFLLLVVAALANTGLAVFQRMRAGAGAIRIGRMDCGVAALLAGFTLFGNLASAWAIQGLSPALLNVLLRSDVFFVALLAWFLLGERVDRRFWLGAIIAALGLVMLQLPLERSSPSGLLPSATGFAIVAAACFSCLLIVTRRFIHAIDPIAVNAIRLWFSVALWFPFYDLPAWDELPREQIVLASAAAITGPFFSRLALMMSARDVEARITTLASLSTPVITLGLAGALLADWPTRGELLGSAVMIAGISIPLLWPRERAG